MAYAGMNYYRYIKLVSDVTVHFNESSKYLIIIVHELFKVIGPLDDNHTQTFAFEKNGSYYFTLFFSRNRINRRTPI